jgi:hypothetical protein
MTRRKLPNGHRLTREAGRRIRCRCGKPARFCEYMRWSCGPGISFFYMCEECWRKPGPYGDTPEERASRPEKGRGYRVTVRSSQSALESSAFLPQARLLSSAPPVGQAPSLGVSWCRFSGADCGK